MRKDIKRMRLRDIKFDRQIRRQTKTNTEKEENVDPNLKKNHIKFLISCFTTELTHL